MQSTLVLFIMPLTYILSFIYAAFIRQYIFCRVPFKKYLILIYMFTIIFTLLDYELSFIPKENLFTLSISFILYFLFTPFVISLINSFYLLKSAVRIVLNLAVVFVSVPIMFQSYMFAFSILY